MVVGVTKRNKVNPDSIDITGVEVKLLTDTTDIADQV